MSELTEEELALLADEAPVQERPARRGRKPGPKRVGASTDQPVVETPLETPVEPEPVVEPTEPPVEPAFGAPAETPIERGVEAPVSEQAQQEADEPQELVERREQADTPAPARGPHTPAQYDDDGWGGIPVQMRG